MPHSVYGSEMWDLTMNPADDSTRPTNGAFGTFCSCHQPWNSSPLGSTACHSDNQDQAVEAVWSHRSLRPRSRSMHVLSMLHWRPAEGIDSINVAAHRRAESSTSKYRAVGGLQAFCTNPHAPWRQAVETATLLQQLACSIMMMMNYT